MKYATRVMLASLFCFLTLGMSGISPSVAGAISYLPGEGSCNQAAFAQTYMQGGGFVTFGTPTNAVHKWGTGYTQDFRGGTQIGSFLM